MITIDHIGLPAQANEDAARHLAHNKEFDAIVQRLRALAIPYGNDPNDPANGHLAHPLAPQGLYFRTPDGHLIEVITPPAPRTPR